MTIALLVHTIDGNDSFNLTALSPPLQFDGAIKPDYIQGLHKGTIAIINVETLLNDLQINSMHIKESMS
jgi:chemotaxis signal transduction protein